MSEYSELVFVLWQLAGCSGVAGVLALFLLSNHPDQDALEVWTLGFLGVAAIAAGMAMLLGGV